MKLSAYVEASEDPKMRKQGTAGERKHVTLMIIQKLDTIRRPEHVQGFQQLIINCVCYKEAEVPIMIFFGIT